MTWRESDGLGTIGVNTRPAVYRLVFRILGPQAGHWTTSIEREKCFAGREAESNKILRKMAKPSGLIQKVQFRKLKDRPGAAVSHEGQEGNWKTAINLRKTLLKLLCKCIRKPDKHTKTELLYTN